MKQLVIIPGGFHPFHKGHKSLYAAAVKAFPQADTYIAATSDTSTRPFPFELKKKLAQLAGIPKERFVEVKSPFRPQEITKHYDPQSTALIYVRSEKDRDTSPQPDQTKKDGEPSYLQSIHGLKKSELQPLSTHGYVAYLPTITFGSADMTSSTEIRNKWPEYNDEQKSELIQILYPVTTRDNRLEKKVIQLFDQVLGSEQLSEKWSKKYKDSINCSNPKGFSQKAHCKGKKKKQNEDVEHFPNDNLEYIGNCTENECIDEIFGDVNEFARLVDEYGDEFEIKDLVVKYDEDQDIHHFYWKNISENLTHNFKVKKKKQNKSSVMEALKPVLKNAVTEFKNGNTENLNDFLSQWEQISEIVDKAKHIANPLKEDVYDVLDSESCGPFDGGCLLVAKALQEIHDGKIIVLVDDKNIAQHAAVLLPNGKIADYDGVKEPRQFIKDFNKNELANIVNIRKLESDDLESASRNFDLVPELVNTLQSKFSPDYISEESSDSEVIQEIFDKPEEIEKTNDENNFVRYDGFVSGEQIVVFMKEIKENIWEIEFRVGGKQNTRGDKSGDEIAIFSTAFSAIKQFVEDRNPETLVFTAVKKEFGQATNRANLYKRMIDRFANKYGYLNQVIDKPSDNESVFVLKRADTVLYNTRIPAE